MTDRFVSSIHIQKLGHKILEIRERALLNIVSKLEHGFVYDNDFARSREILSRLLEWCLIEPCTHQEVALKLIQRILKSESGTILINHHGATAITAEIKQVRSYVKSTLYPLVDELLDIVEKSTQVNMEAPPVPPLQSDLPNEPYKYVKNLIEFPEKNQDENQAMNKKNELEKSTNTQEKRIKAGKYKKEQISKRRVSRIGTWNVRGTYNEGALRNLVNIMKEYKIDVLALQETKQKGKEIISVDGYTLFNSGGEDGYLGVGFIVSKEYRDSIADFEAINERTCRLRIRGKYRKITILNIHAPTEDKDVQIKSDFYEEVGKILGKVPRYDIKLILGDMNAKIGREEVYRNVTGGNSQHPVSNENGNIVIKFAAENDLKVMSTSFQHKEIHQATWIAPDGRTTNQIDHVLIESKHKGCVNDVRSYRGADADSDHILVVTKLKQLVPTSTETARNFRERYNMEKLQEENTPVNMRKELDGKLKKKIKINNIEEEWREIETIGQESMKKCLGRRTRGEKKEWFDNQCKTALQIRNTARIKLLQQNTEENKRKYEDAKKKAKQMCRQRKRRYLEGKLEKIEQTDSEENRGNVV